MADVQLRTLDVRRSSHGGNIYAFARAQGVIPERVLDFSASINPLGWPRRAAIAYRRALARIGHYPEPYAESLRAGLATFHSLDPSSILVGNGSTQLIFLLARTLVTQRVLLVTPLFSEHEAAFRLSSARIGHFFLRPPTFTVSLERLKGYLSRSYDAVVLTNPNSPTGTLVPRPQMEELARSCQRTHTKLIVDETFIDWGEEDSLKQLAAFSTHLIVLRSLTKFFALPGLRVGYLITQPPLVKRLRMRMEPWSVNTVAQEVALACLQDQQFVEQSRAFMARERSWLFEQLAALRGLQPFPSLANFLLVRVALDTLNASTVAQALAKENLLVRTCRDFPGLGEQFFRIAVRTRQENRRLLTALQTVLEQTY